MNSFNTIPMAAKTKIILKALPAKAGGKGDNPTVLSLQGELTIDYAEQLREFLMENLGKYSSFTLKINNVESIDVSAVQLLQRFNWDAAEQKKKVEFDIKLPEEHRSLLEKSGFAHFLSLNEKL